MTTEFRWFAHYEPDVAHSVDVPDGTVHQMLLDSAARFPDQTALRGAAGEGRPMEATHLASAEKRREALAMVIHKKILNEGYRVESESEFQAVLVTGKKTNHLLHLILSIVTLGLWLIVWAVIALSGDPVKGNLLDNALFTPNASQAGTIRSGFAQTSGITSAQPGTVLNIPVRVIGSPGDKSPLQSPGGIPRPPEPPVEPLPVFPSPVPGIVPSELAPRTSPLIC